MAPESMTEGVFLMEREPDSAARSSFVIVKLKQDNAEDVLRGPLADGYHIAVLMSDVAVLER